MKKMPALAFALLALCCSAPAMDIGVGYSAGSPSVNIQWNGALSSGMGVSWYYNQSADPYTYSVFTYTVTPLTWSFFRNEFGSLSTGLAFGGEIRFNESPAYTLITANDYLLRLSAPEMELNVPWVDGLRITAMMSVNFRWYHDDRTGDFTGYRISFSGFSLGTLGLMYYFSAGGAPEKSAAAADITTLSADGVTTTAK